MSCQTGTQFVQRMSLVFIAVLLVCMPALSQVVTADFEDGSDGWTNFGGPTVAVSTDVANTGTHSLLTTNRTQTFQGPGIDLTSVLTAGQPYLFKIAVRLSDSTPSAGDTVRMTMKSIIGGASPAFSTVASSSAVTNTGWVILQGSYTPPANFTPPPTGTDNLFLYIEDDSNAAAEYYVDTFSVSVTSGGCTVPPDNSGIMSDFEDGTAQGWSTRFGLNTVTNTTADAHTGAHSLIVTGRTANFQGPARDITGKMCNGQQYWVEAWVKMAPGQPPTSINMSLQLTDAAGALSFPSVKNSPVQVTDSAWVRIKAKPYTFSGAYTNLQLYLQTNNGAGSATASFYIDDVKVQFLPPPVIENIPSIAQTYSGDFLVGFAALQSDLSGVHAQLAALHYNSVTPGNDLKWDTTEKTEGNFNFVPGDNILNFAQSHGIKMRGHTFVWHNQVPAWVFLDQNGVDMSTEPYSDANKALLLSRLKNHIDALINHYQGNIYVWDVVNEAIDENKPDGFRRSKWYAITVDPTNPGPAPEYMDDAFIYAREALDALGISRDQVKLCYNDFNTTIAAKRQFIYNWVKGAIGRGVPIDCVGNQFHNTINFPIDDQGSASSKQNVTDTLNLFASLISTAGVPIINEVTEFDISLYRFGNCSQTFYSDYDDLLAGDTTDLINQGYRYRDYFQIFKNLKNEIDSVTIWGLGDDESWLNPNVNAAGCSGITAADGPLPFDAYLQHKQAYDGMVNPLALPGANLVTTIAANSGTVLSGHSATFVITVANNGPNDAAGLTFTDTLPAGTTLQSFTASPDWTCTTPAVGGTGDVSCTASTLTNGSAAQFMLVVAVPCTTANGTEIMDAASVASTTLNPNPTPQNSASLTIAVSDPAPVISRVSASLPFLWPPAGEFVPELIRYDVSATCDSNPALALSVSVNQTDRDINRDYKVINPHLVWVEAERAPGSQERVYTITVTATDSAGASSNASVDVKVLRFPDDRHDDDDRH
ncbi:MAG TPA: endo-1,4-beta-xylanase [Terriglobales bacterium]|nr:endo-1,4-beta-xylanase [Terriglobales bacterium]